MNILIDYLEEILITLGLIVFSICGFSISFTFGLLFTSLSFLIGAVITMYFKKIGGEKDESK